MNKQLEPLIEPLNANNEDINSEHARRITAAVSQTRALFNTGLTLSYQNRLDTLLRLQKLIVANKDAIFGSLKKDLNKSRYESYMTEYGLVMAELDYCIKNLKKWMRPQSKRPALAQLPARVKVHSVPYGTVLIMSPWNYPFQLTIIPLIGAIAAGNAVIIKPSDYSKETSRILESLLNNEFKDGRINVILGSREANQTLLDQEFDYIFFTGSPNVGKIVMHKAALHLTPITLELGGKSPCIIDKDTDLQKAAKSIIFGKMLNLGQTCVAPDYLLIHANVYEAFCNVLISTYESMLRPEYVKKHLPWIINNKHLARITKLMQDVTPLYQAPFNPEQPLQYPFTLVEAGLDSPLMQEELFAPIFPMLKFETLEDLKAIINANKNPLALYLFTDNSQLQRQIVEEINFGGGCINDTIMHIGSHHQPFGGVGNSGMGQYHGYYSFLTFTHQKTIVSKSRYFDLPLRYHPFKNPDKDLLPFLFK